MFIFLLETTTSISFGSQEIRFKCRILHIPLVCISTQTPQLLALCKQINNDELTLAHHTAQLCTIVMDKGKELSWINEVPNYKMKDLPFTAGSEGVKQRKLTLTLYVQLGHWQRSPKPFFLTEPSKTIQNVKEYLQQISKDSVEKFIMVYLMFKLT